MTDQMSGGAFSPEKRSERGLTPGTIEVDNVESSRENSPERVEDQNYQFYYVPLEAIVGSSTVDTESEVHACIVYLSRFLSQFNEYQVVALTFPLEELEAFFSQLETFMNIFKERTGFAFAPVILQRSLFCPDSEFMVIMHKVSMIDAKLPNIALYKNISKIAGAFTL